MLVIVNVNISHWHSRLGVLRQTAYAESVSCDIFISMSGVELRTSGTSGPSVDIFISISTWLRSRRHRSESRILFSVK